ncbi:MAG: S8 family serine peptidase [Alphaproteobacteria bacterium]|nr:S8 family serine peptidase [Alphaproteobacteria bacterium]
MSNPSGTLAPTTKTEPLSGLEGAAVEFAAMGNLSPASALDTSSAGTAAAVAGLGAEITIDATATNGDGAALLGQLEAIGLSDGASFGGTVSGELPLTETRALSGVPDLARVVPDGLTVSAAPIPAQEAEALGASQIAAGYGLNGSGVTVGILSDSFNTSGSPDTMASDIANGYLPADTQDLKDSANGTDEGRAMAELVHEIAPGSAILFETAEGGEAAFADNILDLASHGAKVIVDDASYFAEPAFQDGVVAQAVEQVEAEGVVYVSAAGNNAANGYEGTFSAGAPFAAAGYSYSAADDFSPGNSLLPVAFSGANTTVAFVLQWSQPAASASPGKGASSDLDLFLTDATGSTIYGAATANNLGGDPIEVLLVKTNGFAGTAYLRVGLFAGQAPAEIRLMAVDDSTGVVAFGAEASNLDIATLYGHAGAAGVIAVGAACDTATPAFGSTPPTSEPYSSAGPDTILFDSNGNPLPTPRVATVTATGVDGADTSFFGTDTDGDGLPNFYGTSAAAPSAAAVAALMLQANAALSPSDIENLLEDSSIAMTDPEVSGAGLIQADKAVAYAVTGTIAAFAGGNATLYGTHFGNRVGGGNGADTFYVEGGINTIAGGFSRVELAAGNDTVELPDAAFAGMAGIAVADLAKGNDTLDASPDSTASSGESLTYALGSGRNHFVGGYENDLLFVAAGSIGGDVLTGGAGSNSLALTGAGAAPLSGVSGFATVSLYGSAESVGIATGNFAGIGAMLVVDNAGDNRIDASSDDSAKTLTFVAASGDSFAGGFETDAVFAAAATVGSDTLTGGSGSSFLNLQGSGSAVLSGITGFSVISLYGSGESVRLTTGDFAGIAALWAVDNAGGNTLDATADRSGQTLVFAASPGDTFAGGFETDEVTIAAAGLTGTRLVGGGGTNFLNLQGSGSADLGAVGRFANISLYGAGETVTLGTGNFAGLGEVLVSDNSGDNALDASADRSGATLAFFAKAGDSFVGGFETDLVYAAASDVGHEALRGGLGTSILELQGSGAADLSGVSGFEAIDLGAAGSSVAITDANFSAMTAPVLTVTASAGDNILDGSAVSQSDHALELVGGSGTDTMQGGSGNDVIVFGGGGDSVSGGGGSNEFVWDAHSTLSQTQSIADFAAVAGGDACDFSQLATGFSGDPVAYVGAADVAAGTELFFDPGGNARFGSPVALLRGVHGLSVDQLYAQHNLLL